ncbi:YpiB family protein [Bacillus thuringiensis]|uniref:YpiB family protein n=1 Tax=Bacillus thuringiensis TaxID=1428 RepID=UPI0011A7CA34|nr:YpiB family protein [Bacillus thuringiensis]
MNKVSVEKKLAFIEWLVDNLERKIRRGFASLVTFSDERFINRIHFVENARKYPYGIEISAACSEGEASAFYTSEGVLNSLRAPYEHFVENKDQIYIQINFRGKYENVQYLDVLEDDECSLQTYLDGEDHEVIENLLTKQLIDYALDTKDEALFKKLVMK